MGRAELRETERELRCPRSLRLCEQGSELGRGRAARVWVSAWPSLCYPPCSLLPAFPPWEEGRDWCSSFLHKGCLWEAAPLAQAGPVSVLCE